MLDFTEFGLIQSAHRASKTSRKFSLKLEHFRRWVEIFGAMVDKLFTGETAENAKLRAKIISYSLNQRTNQDSTQINSKTSN
jgi:hypothetical protein